MSLRPGDAFECPALVVADQAGQQVGLAVLQPDHRVDLAIAERGQPAEADARDVADGNLQRQRHLIVVVRPRRDVDVHADVLVVERRDRLLGDAAGGDRRERRDRHRHALAEPGLRGNAFRGPQLRVGQRAGVLVGLEQSVEEARQVGQEDVRLREVAQVAQRHAVAVDRHLRRRCRSARVAGRGDLQRRNSRSRVRSTSSSSTSMTTSGRALSMAAISLPRRGHALGRVLDGDGVGGRGGRHAPHIDDDPQQVHRFLQVGVAQEEGADDLLLVLAALGRRVGHDGDGALGRDPVEVAGGRRHRLQRRFERAVAQVDRHRLVAEGRIEDDVDAGEAPERGEDVARAGVAEGQHRRHLRVGREVQADRRQIARALDQAFRAGSCPRESPPPWCGAASGRR